MSLRHALLGLLAVESRSGYYLSRAFAGELGRYAWQAGHTRIYPELVRMELAQDYPLTQRQVARYRRRAAASVPALSPGSVGRPTLASAEKGARLYKMIHERIATRVLGAVAA